MIRARFKSQTLTSQGVVMVSLFINGQEQWVIMDDYIPTKNDRPVFVHSKSDGEMWPSLLEKAWAKVVGSYARVEFGRPADAALTLLGVPGKLYDVVDYDQAATLLPKIVEGCARNDFCFCTSKETGNAHGIVNNHEYEFKDIYELEGLTLVKLRNPWGSTEYNGAWKADSDNWTDDIKDAVGYDDLINDSGILFMEWHEWVDAYRNLTICVQANVNTYKHSGSTMLDFNESDNCNAFLRFTLHEDYDCH